MAEPLLIARHGDTLCSLHPSMVNRHGLITGATGSGKTTTLYSALSYLNEVTDKIITTEDPVEYEIEGLVQCPINHEIGLTFASALRAILRQDPDRILVGEIRDLETAQIAVQASLTGHTVFSTLHTNDAPSTITRMRDMGLEPFLITATVEAVLAQRLVRRICTNCRTNNARHTKQHCCGDSGKNTVCECVTNKCQTAQHNKRSCNCACASHQDSAEKRKTHELVVSKRVKEIVHRNASTI